MKKLLQKCMLIMVMFMTVKQVNAQDQHIIQGTVTSKEDSQPLRGVNVMVKGTHVGTTTDLKGAYSLKVSDSDAALEFSFSGYISETVALGKNTTLDVQLEPDTKVLESVALVGYGTQKRIEVTSAVATVKSGEFVKGSVKDIGQLLQGKVAGLTIGTPSGDPNASSQILLRGIATLFSSTQPLILVDGIPEGLNSVAPEDIERIDVLKDGSAAA
ncbi:MAG TPA: carboxypeptidase-like regulatory domain-containing protein, partial [Hanamia sp.]|nr:carboxypeptidase-like regulatory domain-containing protein [Hanamia sp.]